MSLDHNLGSFAFAISSSGGFRIKLVVPLTETCFLNRRPLFSKVCLDPDASLLKRIDERGSFCAVLTGFLGKDGRHSDGCG